MSISFTRFSRRDFVKIIPLLLFTVFSIVFGSIKFFSPKLPKKFKGKIMGANAKIGHMMRMGNFPKASVFSKVQTVIVGGGMAGLSAGWWLNKHNHKDFLILELDQKAGGNSQSGENEVSAYPWAAHYVPLPGPDAYYVKTLLEELGVIKGHENGLPVYDEYYLCADPHERIFFLGRWHPGVLPESGVPMEDKKQYAEFFAFMKEMSKSKGHDQKWAMTIPLDLSSRDPKFLKFDKLSMASFMQEKGWTSRYLKWYVDYCCRDDYGQTADQVSAWAGIHYFASRSGKAANSGKESVLTWPQGNGWLVQKIEEKFPDSILKNSLVYKVEKKNDDLIVTYFDVDKKISHEITAKDVIYAAPRFTGKYILDKSLGKLHDPKMNFVPWMVANVTVKQKPQGQGQELSWDNVSFYSKSLGYIVSTHQGLNPLQKETVLTYYLPLNDHAPAIERKLALERDHTYWANLVGADLEKMHPGIQETISRIDVWVWGHGMVGPGIDFLWGDARKKMLESLGNLHFAHSDMSGISIFEEAQYRGVTAARKILEKRV